MTQFATTADIRSAEDSSILSYIRLYILTFAGMVAIDLVIRSFSVGLSGPGGPAAMAAFLCTAPKRKPRFRSVARFAIAVLLACLLAFATAVTYKINGVGNVAVASWILTALSCTIILGCIESLSFWWTCLLTPGWELGDPTADNSGSGGQR